MWSPACSHGCMMKAHWWGCLLGLLCMSTEVTLSFWTASQSPSSITQVRVNSSVEIVCTTSLLDPTGLSLYGHFHNNKYIAFLYIEKGVLKKLTLDTAFQNRTEITPVQVDLGLGFTLKLSLLGLEDTDLYYCQWSYLDKDEESLKSNGTIIIVREGGPPEQCKAPSVDPIIIFLVVAVFVALLLIIIIGVLVRKCRRFKKTFKPARPSRPPPRPPRPPRPNRPQHVCLQHQHQQQQQTRQLYSYLTTSPYTSAFRDI